MALKRTICTADLVFVRCTQFPKTLLLFLFSGYFTKLPSLYRGSWSVHEFECFVC